MDEPVREYWDIYPLRDLILDHGNEFGAHRINKYGYGIASSKNMLKH
jgi:hypothetical protein